MAVLLLLCLFFSRDFLEDIVSNVEKKRLQSQLLKAVADASSTSVKDTTVWSELTLTGTFKFQSPDLSLT